jgi:putative addiction module component (TIGR02574 family)
LAFGNAEVLRLTEPRSDRRRGHDAVRAPLDRPDFFEDFSRYHALAKCLWPIKFNSMSATKILAELRRMPENERRETVQQILDEFTEFDDELTPEQIAELERRAEDARKNPGRGIPAEQVFAEIEERGAARRKNPACVDNSKE